MTSFKAPFLRGPALPVMEAASGRCPSKGVGMRSFMILAVVLALSLALVTPSAVAAEPRSSGHRGGDLLSSLWNLLLTKWSVGDVQKEGARIESLGGSQGSAPTTEAGCFIDPLGGCQEVAPTSEEGYFIDPLR
jgi:hypothetical protein